MKIKEVEEKTGLPAKTIRFYESQGLLKVRRAENFYREYTSVDVERFMKIKLLRRLDVPVSEIKAYFDGRKKLVDILRERLAEIGTHKIKAETKELILEEMIKSLNDDESFDVMTFAEGVDFVDSDEYVELVEQINKSAGMDLISMVCTTLTCLGPILWLFIKLASGDLRKIILIAVFAVVSAGLLGYLWPGYLKQKNKHCKSNLWLLLGTIGAALGYLFVVGGISQLKLHFFIPEGSVLVDTVYFSGIWLFLGYVLFVVGCFLWLYKKATFLSWLWADACCRWIYKYRAVVLILCMGLLYILMTNQLVVTEDAICEYHFYRPWLVKYSFSEIALVETGYDESGDFYYIVTLKEGECFSLYSGYPVSQKTVYEALLLVDNMINKQSGVEKRYSMQYASVRPYDEETADLIAKIILNGT